MRVFRGWLLYLWVGSIVVLSGLGSAFALVYEIVEYPISNTYKVKFLAPDHVVAVKGDLFSSHYVRYERNGQVATLVVRNGFKHELRRLRHFRTDEPVLISYHQVVAGEVWRDVELPEAMSHGWNGYPNFGETMRGIDAAIREQKQAESTVALFRDHK
jgi:hypothetical protein